MGGRMLVGLGLGLLLLALLLPAQTNAQGQGTTGASVAATVGARTSAGAASSTNILQSTVSLLVGSLALLLHLYC